MTATVAGILLNRKHALNILGLRKQPANSILIQYWHAASLTATLTDAMG